MGAAVDKHVPSTSPMRPAGFFPLEGRRLQKREPRKRTLRGLHGAVELTLRWGRDPRDQRWCGPLREAWGVRPHQEFTPGARRRLGFTVSTRGTSAEAAELAVEGGLPVDASTLHALVQPAGGRAEEQTVERLETPVAECESARGPCS